MSLLTGSLLIVSLAESLDQFVCEQPYELNPRWCSVAVYCPCGGRQRVNGSEPLPFPPEQRIANDRPPRPVARIKMTVRSEPRR
jgi:hypothetical protein